MAHAPGPLPLPWGERRTDVDLRSTYLGRNAATLYGLSAGSLRSHLFLDVPLGQGASATQVKATAAEYVEVPLAEDESLRFAVIHLDALGPEAVAAYQQAARLLCTPGSDLASMAWPRFGIAVDHEANRSRRVTATSLLVTEGGVDLGHATGGGPWSPATRLLWEIASLSPWDRYPPDETDPDLLRETVHLSRSWRGLVLRDGIGFVFGPRAGEDPYQLHAKVLVRSVYSDIALLAKVQRHLTVDLAERMAALELETVGAAQLALLSKRSLALHSRVWTQDITDGSHGNQLLLAAQRQLGTADLFSRVTASLAFVRQEIEDQEHLRAAEAEKRRRAHEEALEVTVRRLAALVVGASFAFGLLGINLRGVTSGDGITVGMALAVVVPVAALGYLVVLLLTRTRSD